ncbi:unnamed protein product [Cuscuta epithymum]|uniref:Uncharacterized protein n=1 Tax=Cuscuta epithymum TaxID=186058 RepID=A0AAV0G6X5_9ASTE|nr:unnamed protein product [Cuscuta epithymum]CAH9143317.1 unnamed protein product [Cuscuta epithymum]
MKSIILLKEVKVKQPPLLLEHSPRENTNFEWDLVTLDRDLPPNELSISGTLFQIDVEKSDLCDQSLVLHSEIDSSLSHLKDFFQTIMTQGVDSLSKFLIKEFERIIAGKHGEEQHTTECTPTDSLRNVSSGNSQKGPLEKGKATRCTFLENPMEAYTGYQQGFDFEEAYSDSFFSHPENEYLGHASENENRVPISTVEDLWDTKLC